MTEDMSAIRRKRHAHVQNPEPSIGWYAEAKDLVKRIDPKHGVCEWDIGKRSWRVCLGGREALMPFEKGCALDQLYKAEKSRPITDDHYTRELREDAVYRLVAIMELNAV